MPMLPKLQLSICDVRDVATAHLKSLTLPDAPGMSIENHKGFLKRVSGIGELPSDQLLVYACLYISTFLLVTTQNL
jgi:hypothetical protein